MHSMAPFVPWISTSFSADVPARVCKPSMFCVMNYLDLPGTLQVRDGVVGSVGLGVPERRPRL